VPPGWLPNKNWQVEYHSAAEDHGFPLGVAWVTYDPPPKRRKQNSPALRPDGWVKFVLVADDARRRGIATALVEAILERWPGVRLTGPVSEAGGHLYRKFAKPFTVDQLYSPEFIADAQRAGVPMEDFERLTAKWNEALGPGLTGAEAARPKRRRRKPR
jgi:GNAT superfamily N-acetyltransferase